MDLVSCSTSTSLNDPVDLWPFSSGTLAGANEREVLQPLGHQIATSGVTTVVPDWSCDEGGRGRHHLTASLAFTQELSERIGLSRVSLAGWSLGPNAGLDVVLLTTILGGWRPAAFIGISGGFDDSPYYRRGSFDIAVDPSVPLLLIHRSSDEVVPVELARVTYESLRRAGWEITLREVEADHAGRCSRRDIRPQRSPVCFHRRPHSSTTVGDHRPVDCRFRAHCLMGISKRQFGGAS